MTNDAERGMPDMLDPITCERCGRDTYAQMARCPQCGHAIAAPDAPLSLPPEYVCENEAGVWIYPETSAAAKLNLRWLALGCLILAGGLYALWASMAGDAWRPGFLVLFLLATILGGPIAFQTLYASYRLLRTLPVFYMGREGMAFPYVGSTLLPWENLRDVQVLEIDQKPLRSRLLKIDLHTPMEIASTSMARLLIRGPQPSIAVPISAGWPLAPKELKDLIGLGSETWAKDRNNATAAPIHPERDFERTIRQAQGFALLVLLVPFISSIILLVAI